MSRLIILLSGLGVAFGGYYASAVCVSASCIPVDVEKIDNAFTECYFFSSQTADPLLSEAGDMGGDPAPTGNTIIGTSTETTCCTAHCAGVPSRAYDISGGNFANCSEYADSFQIPQYYCPDGAGS